MAIDSLSSNASVNFAQFSTSSPAATKPQGDADGDGGAGRIPGGGKFADAIARTLTQVTGGSSSSTGSTGSTSGTDASSSTQDSQQAESAFTQSLFTALQSQFASKQGGASGTGESGGHHHSHGGGGAGGGGKIAGALQNLAQQLTSGSSDGSSGTSGTSSAVSSLQTSFNNLLAANGQSGGSASLPQFLQTLAQNLQGAPSSGNVVSTKV